MEDELDESMKLNDECEGAEVVICSICSSISPSSFPLITAAAALECRFLLIGGGCNICCNRSVFILLLLVVVAVRLSISFLLWLAFSRLSRFEDDGELMNRLPNNLQRVKEINDDDDGGVLACRPWILDGDGDGS
jgi:hypothetical protein